MTEAGCIRKLSDDQVQIVRLVSETFHAVLNGFHDLDRYEVTGAADPEAVAQLVAARLPPEIGQYILAR